MVLGTFLSILSIGGLTLLDPGRSWSDGQIVKPGADDGAKVATPFGEGTVKELPDHYEIVIDAHVGSFVRSGGLIGQITKIDDRFISIDYSRPFGGVALLCDVLVESLKPGPK